MRTLIEIHFRKLDRRPEFYDGVHQVLMTGERDVTLSHGSEIVNLPYDSIREIRISFSGES